MKPISDILDERVSAALTRLAGGQPAPAVVRATQDLRFGDYQANGVMALAKRLKTNPRQLATELVELLDLSDLCEAVDIAGPGFINFRLKPQWIRDRLVEAAADPDRLGVDRAPEAPTTVVDFSAPNIAKQMHVGHLRSTIIGDTIARVLDFWYGQPDRVIRQNHVGDWGTQFGMLTYYLDWLAETCEPTEHSPVRGHRGAESVADMEQFYRQAKEHFDSDPAFAAESRRYVVRLQSHDPHVLENWQVIREASLQHAQDVYDLLGVRLTRDDVRGESEYNQDLPRVIDDLDSKGLLTESEGARVVFLEGFKAKSGEPLPLIVRKSDGGYLYATTDLAAVRYRTGELGARRVIYVTDARQKLHFDMVFACARQAGFAGDAALEHVPFGSVLGPDGKPFKTRSGENVKLRDLLDEATNRAQAIVEEKNPVLPADQKARIARAVGIGAVKYADLSSNLTSDYVFDWSRMLAMEGNTAPYMQYAYARVRSIFRKGGVTEDEITDNLDRVALDQPAELVLAKVLLRYGETVEAVARDLRPHLLTSYLFELAQAFSVFYTNCPVLQAAEPARTSRLLLSLLTARTIAHGLDLLGIETIEQM